MSLTESLRKVQARTWAERRMVLEACCWLALMRAAVLLVSFQRTVVVLGLTQGETPSAMLAQQQSVIAARIGWAVQAAARRTPWESACLAQALAGMIMLQRRGIPAVLYLGVAKDRNSAEGMAAHAWLQCGEFVLTGSAGHERYAVISAFSGSQGR